MAKQDKSTRDIRSRLKDMGMKPVKYSVGIGKLFIQGSGKEYFKDTMPNAVAMYETNQDLLKDTVKFLRNPADAIKRQIDKALGSEDFKAVQRLVTNAVDDLKTGEFYNADRDRTEFGSGVDSLLDDFGGFDMDGFDENGDWGDIDVDPDTDAEVKIAQAQEDSDAKRTEATINAVGSATEAIINNDNNNARDRLKMSVKQHSQSMMAMQNLITSSTATFEMMNNNMKVMTSVVSEASSQILSNMGEIKTLLAEIRDLNKSDEVDKTYKEPTSVFSDNGALDIRAYLKNSMKNAKEKLNLDMLSVGTGGLSIAQMIDLYADNPWQIVSDALFKKMIPDTLQKSLEAFNKSLGNFFPALLTKLFTRGKDAENEGGTWKDLLAGIFGFKQRSRSSINPEDYNPLGKAQITNKFVKSVEEVIPMWLSRIDSHISGQPLQQFNYTSGKLESVASNIAKYEHSSRDLVGRMGDSQYAFFDRLQALNFKTDKDKEDAQTYLYKFLQKNAEEGNFINPKIDAKEFKQKYMPTTSNPDYYYNIIKGIMDSMRRDELMALSKDIMDARAGRDRYNKSMNDELRDSGLITAFGGWMDEDLASKLADETRDKRLGLSKDDIADITKKYNAKNATGMDGTKYNTNGLLLDISNTLKGGIITFNYNTGDAGLMGDAVNPELAKMFDRVKSRQASVVTQEQRAADKDREDQERTIQNQAAQKKKFDELLKISNYNGLVVNSEVSAGNITDALMGVDISRMDKAEAERRAKLDKNFKIMYDQYKDKAKAKTDELSEKSGFNKLVATVQQVFNEPFKLAEKGINYMDAMLFKFLYGDDIDVELAGTNDHYLISSISNLFKAQFLNIKSWFSENIGEPLKKFLFDKDDGIFSGVKKFFKESLVDPIKDTVIGKKNEQGFYDGGMLSGALNAGKYKIDEAKYKMKKKSQSFGEYAIDEAKGAINKVLYGDYVQGKGKEFVQDVDDDGNIVSGVEYGGIVGMFKKGFQKFKEFMLGDDWDVNNESKKAWDATKHEVETALPGIKKGALKGAAATLGMGLLGGLWLPGGPIMGAMLGSVGGFITSSDKFKKWIFGEDVTDDDGNVTHTGGLISKEVQDGFKKFAPKVAGGFAIGSIAGNMGLLPFGIGPILGGILGSMGGMIAASDKMKNLIFGDMVDEIDDETGKKTGKKVRGDNGLIPAEWQKNIKKALPGIGIGALGGTIVGGLIPGIAMLPGGPILGGLAGLAASLSGDKFNNFLFGEEEEVVDEKTGKKKKTRNGGVFGRMFNFGRDKIVAPFFKQLDTWGKSIGKWFEDSIVTPFSNAIQPFRDAMSDTASNIRKSLANIGQSIKDSINGVFEKFVGKPLGEFFQEKIIDPMKNMLSKLFGGIGKFIGGIISAPFKAMEFIFTGKVSGSKKENDKQKTNWIKKLFGLTDEQIAERDKKKKEKDAVRQARKDARKAWWERTKANIAERFASPGEKLDRWYHGTHDADGFTYIGSDGKEHYGNAHGGTPIDGSSSKSNKPTPMAMPDDYSADPNAYKEYDNDYNAPDGAKVPEPGQPVPKKKPKTKGQLRSEEKQRRKQLAKEETERRAKANSDKEEKGKSIDERFKEFRKKKQGEREKKKKEREEKADARKKLKDAKRSQKSYSSSSSKESKDSSDKDKTKPESDKSNKKIGRKSDNDYLSSISKSSKKIADEISGQLGGTGWNLAYIKTLLEKKFGGLSSDELPENMEGSTKNVKKKRGFFGRMKDRVGGVLGGIKDGVVDFGSRAWDTVTSPFRFIYGIGSEIVGAAKEVITGIGGFLKNTLGKMLDVATTALAEGAKTVIHVFGEAIKGAADFLSGAAKGLGQALGNLAGTVTGVAKNILVAGTSLLAGAVQTVAKIAPDVISGIWGGVKTLSKGLWGGAKFLGKLGIGAVGFAGDKIGDLFSKITGKPRKGKTKNIGTFKIAGGFIDTIKDGVKMMLGDGDNTKPFPFVNLSKGVARSAPTLAIPVYLAGAYKKLLNDGDNSGDSDNTPTKREDDNTSADPSKPSATPQAPSPDEPKVNTDPTKGPLGKIIEEPREKTSLKGRKAVRSTRKMIPMSYGGTPNIQQTVSGSEDWAEQALLNESQEVRDYVKAYKDADTKVSRAKDPKKAYDNVMEQAKTSNDIEALKTVKDLNDIGGNDKSIVPIKSGGSSDTEEKSGGLLSTIGAFLTNLFNPGGNGGLLKQLGSWFMNTKVGQTLGKIGGGIATVAKSAGSTLLNNLPFFAGTYKAVAEGDNERVGVNVTKQLPKVGKWAVKSAQGAMDIITSPEGTGVKANLASKLLSKFRNALTKVLSSRTVQSVMAKVGKNVDTSKIASGVISKFDDILLKLGSEAAEQLMKKFNLIVLVATAGYDFGTGMYRAAEYFAVSDDDVTWGMRFAAGLAKAISGLAFGLIPISWLSQFIYKLVANKETEAKLKEKQDALKEKADAYNEEHGTSYTPSEFVKSVDEDTGYQKLTTLQKIGNFFTGSKKLDTSKIIKDKTLKNKYKTSQKPPSDYKYETKTEKINGVSRKYYILSKSEMDKWAEASGVSADSGNGRGRKPIRMYGTGETIFSQTDPRWNAQDPSMKDSGCGPTVAAMMASRLGRGVNPVEASQMAYAGGYRDATGGTDPAFFSAYGNAHGVDMQEGPTDKNSIMSGLNSGHPVALMGEKGPYGPGSHYLLAESAKGNTVNLVDPIGGKRVKANASAIASKTTAAIYGSGPSNVPTAMPEAYIPTSAKMAKLITNNKLTASEIGRKTAHVGKVLPDNYGLGAQYRGRLGRGTAKEQAAKVLKIAEGEVGYHEKASNSQLDSKTANPGSNNYTKYGAWYGLNGPDAPWCAMFVAWCCAKAGVSESVVPKTASVAEFTSFAKNHNQFHSKGSYTPQPGDIIIYGSGGSAHTGLVYGTDGSNVITIEGNTSDGNESNGVLCKKKSVPMNDSWIYGYFSPAYDGKTVAFSGSTSTDGDGSDDSSTEESSSNTGLAGFLDKFDTTLNPIKGLTTFADSLSDKVGKLFGYSSSSSSSDSDDSSSSSTSDNSSAASSGNSTARKGQTITLPEGLGKTKTYMGWQCITAKDSTQYKLREAAGMNFDSEGYGKINGRYVIAMTPTYGKVGDYVDIKMTDGSTIKGIIGDEKNMNDAGCNKWGHDNGNTVVEFVVDKNSWYNKKSNPGTDSNHPEWKGIGVTSVTNQGSYFNNGTGRRVKFGRGKTSTFVPENMFTPGKMDATPYMASGIFGKGETESNTSATMRNYITSFSNTLKKIRESAEKDKATDRIVSSIENVAETIKSGNSSGDNETLTTLVSTISTALGQMVSLLESIKSNTEQQVSMATASTATSDMPTVRSSNSSSRNVGSDIIDKLTSK